MESGKEEKIKAVLKGAGCCAVGIAQAGPVDAADAAIYDRWLASGHEAGMAYMHNHRELRMDPRKVLEGCLSVISMAFSYETDATRDGRLPSISAYAMLPDYHIWIRRRIRESGINLILGEENRDWRICVDSAPVRERYWAHRAGLGIIGENGMLIVPGAGCKVLLAEILTNLELRADTPMKGNCGQCGACRRACPAGALHPGGNIDCNHCLSYLTIEHKGEWEDERHKSAMETAAGRATLFGCDRCVNICPHNETTIVSPEPPTECMATLTAADITAGKSLPKDSCLRRAGRKGLLRNAANTDGGLV